MIKDFNDFGIKSKNFTGEKISIDRILNEVIVIEAFKIEKSKYADKGNGKRLDLQIKRGENQHVIFTGSMVMMDIILQLPADAFPFQAKIVRINMHYELRTAKE